MASYTTDLMLRSEAKQKEMLCRVDLEVDTTTLMLALGAKAMRNKNRKAAVANGLIKVSVRVLEG